MSASNPSTATASQPQPPDIQQLLGLLGNLMPLLMRLQSQGFEQPSQTAQDNAVVPNPALDHQAAANLIADMIADSLRTLSAYLETNAALYAGLEGCVPVVTQAAHRFAVRDYAEAFNRIWLAYRVIETIRAADPRIPPPRSASSEQTLSSIH